MATGVTVFMAAHPDQGNRSIIFLNAHKLIFNPSLSLCVTLIFNVWRQVEIFGGLDPCCQHATTTLAADFLFTAHRSDLWIMLFRTCIGTLGFDCMTPWSALALKLATMACAVIFFLPRSNLRILIWHFAGCPLRYLYIHAWLSCEF